MSNFAGQFTITGTGNISISSLGINPNDLRFEVGAKNNSSSVNTRSEGEVDEGLYQFVHGEFDDHAGNYAYWDNNTDCIWVRRHNGSGWVDVLRASVTSYQTGGFVLNVSAFESGGNNWPVKLKARLV